MWIFNSDGLYIYRPDGEELKNHISTTRLCGPKSEFTGSAWRYCRFNDVASDGKKYVWAAVNRNKPMIDLFDIDTGSVVGSFDTCANPQHLEYHSLRDEVWVRCSGVVDGFGEKSNLDVFSASNPSGDIMTNILVKDRALEEGLTSEGYSVIHHTLGDVGFITDKNLPKIFKVDLSSKQIIGNLTLTPLSHGINDAVYSQVNKHIYLRSEVCCECGDDGLQPACSTRPGREPYTVDIITGPSA